MIAPQVIAHADWGTKPRKRQLAAARLLPGSASAKPSYVVMSLKPAAADDLLLSLSRLAAPGQALVGFDYPIGLPRAYGSAAGISSFPEFLVDDLASPPWEHFFDPAGTVDQISIHRPFYPRAPGGTKREHLYAELGLTAPRLRRRCERDDAETMFWTLGGKQVGKGALAGWALLIESLRRGEPPIGIWPLMGVSESCWTDVYA